MRLYYCNIKSNLPPIEWLAQQIKRENHCLNEKRKFSFRAATYKHLIVLQFFGMRDSLDNTIFFDY